MKEFIDKLIERLEENTIQHKEVVKVLNESGTKFVSADKLKEIVNQLAESYHIHCEQEYMRGYADAEKKLAEEYESWVMIDGQYCWQTCGATEHCKECRRLGNGDIDYYESIGEYINTSTEHINCSTKVSEMPTGWIPCERELPPQPKENPLFENKPLELYLVSLNSTDYPWRAFWNGKFFTDGWSRIEPIAWMPLPAPFKEGE